MFRRSKSRSKHTQDSTARKPTFPRLSTTTWYQKLPAAPPAPAGVAANAMNPDVLGPDADRVPNPPGTIVYYKDKKPTTEIGANISGTKDGVGTPPPPEFTNMAEIANERLGGRVLAVNDEWFAAASNLLKADDPVWKTGLFVPTGKWMDGWESKRHLEESWCVIQLGVPGIIHGIDSNTAHFKGNHGPACSLLVLDLTDEPNLTDEEIVARKDWVKVVSSAPNVQSSHNYHAVEKKLRATHVKFYMEPDGGIARLRVFAEVKPDWSKVKGVVDVAAIKFGGVALSCSDQHFGAKDKLLNPWTPVDMGDGWETARSRTPNHSDWVIIKLGHAAKVSKILAHTMHFKGNYPQWCTVHGWKGDEGADAPAADSDDWTLLVDKSKLGPHKGHEFTDIKSSDVMTHVKLTIGPDGGIARFSVFGSLA